VLEKKDVKIKKNRYLIVIFDTVNYFLSM